MTGKVTFNENVESFSYELEDSYEDDWIFPKLSDHLRVTLPSGRLRPLSPTLKEHKVTLPGIESIKERYGGMREWKNIIKFVGNYSKEHKMFNSTHHWNMRTKFLEVRLCCMDKIVEDPDAYRIPQLGFYVRVPKPLHKAVLKCKMADISPISCRKSTNYIKLTRKDIPFYYDNKQLSAQKERSGAVYDIAEVESNSFQPIEEKLHSQSLCKELNIDNEQTNEPSFPLSCSSSFTTFEPALDNTIDVLDVVEKTNSNEVLETEENDCKSEKASDKSSNTDMVLEDVNENDMVSDIVLPSSRKLKADTIHLEKTSSEERSSQSLKRISWPRRPKFRARIASIFSCFKRNKVAPVM